MSKKIFIRVVGFTDVERHALNTVFRLSQRADAGRGHTYEPWLDDNPEVASLALIDGSCGSAAQELANLHQPNAMGFIWVGAVSPASAWRTFSRPLRWPDVLTAIDMYFEPASTLDFDLDSADFPDQLDAVATQAAELAANPPAPPRATALLADPDPEARLYLRTLLSALGLTHIDEAVSVAQAREFLADNTYQFVCIDLGLSDLDPWLVVAAASSARVRLVTGLSLGLGNKLNAKLNGCIAMEKPLQSKKLGELLRNL